MFKMMKTVEAYSKITFEFRKETDLFLAWNQPHSISYDERHQQRSDLLPRAKLEI